MDRSQARPKILIVDDEPEVLASLRDLLRPAYQVTACGNAEQAIAFLEAAPDVAVLISDQRMPGMSGVELLRRAKEIRPETSRLLLTAFSDARTIIDAINQGHVFRYITKPWEPGELEAAIDQGVERYQLIVERNRLVEELKTTNAKLEETDRLKGAFLEVASHELNTPVTVMLGLTEVWKLSMENNTDTPENRQRWLERISASAHRLAKTVQRMLKLVDTKEFGRPIHFEPIEIGPIIREAVAEHSSSLDARSQRVLIQVEPRIGAIEADASKLMDILTNLIANAIKFTPDQGTIRVQAETVPGNPDWVRVSIKDEGIGVLPRDQQYLFEPFFTGFDTLNHSSGDYQFRKRGMGLGLCMVKTFVEYHGGRVELQTSPEKGSSFSFVLPRRQNHAPAIASPKPAHIASASTTRS
jgi:signal transduction histidine kinase